MAAPLVSIALCTYNGSAYLREQLDSLINQSYPNMELIAVDDRSTDDTVDILRRYEKNHPQISIYVNDENLGYTKNFEKAIRLCSGDYIALCDQDDIWDPEKINIMTGLIGNNMMAYHDSAFMDDDGNLMGKRLSDLRNCYSGNDSRVFLFDNCVLGHAMLFKKDLVNLMGSFNDTVIHDRWLAYVAASAGSIIFTDRQLVRYRQHINANTNILKQQRTNSATSSSVYKMQFHLAITTVLAQYRFNKHQEFKNQLLQLVQNRMYSYTSFKLAYFIFKHRDVLLFISKKSAFSKFNFILKFIWGGKIKRSSLFNIDS